MISARFTDGRVPVSKVSFLFKTENRWQRWLDVEAALAVAEASAGIIPSEAALAIRQAASIENLNIEHVQERMAATSHPLMPLVEELSGVVGEPHGGWVHWGATTQNITQTGDALLLRDAHSIFIDQLGELFGALSHLADRSATMVCAGRTHGQQAVPITFGFKVAGWIDELTRSLDRLREIEPRVFTAMLGGAVGNYASLGKQGPKIQDDLAKQLGLHSMAVPSRAANDAQAEYVCALGLLAGTAGKIALEVYVLMTTEYNEVSEPAPEGTVGSSTMPHKRNPQLADDCIAISAQIRALVPLALQGMMHDHEVCGANSLMIDDALERACCLTGDMLNRLVVIISGLELHEENMRENLDLTDGLISSERVMLALGKFIGRQHAHEVVYRAAQDATRGRGEFAELLKTNEEVSQHLSASDIDQLLDPVEQTGLSADLAKDAAVHAAKIATDIAERKASAKQRVRAVSPVHKK